MKDWHRSTAYKDLSYLIGEELSYRGGINFDIIPDGSVYIVKDYGRTVLVEFEWLWSEWWECFKPSRKRKVLIPKASLAVGDVKLFVKSSGIQLTCDVISDLVHSMNCAVRGKYESDNSYIRAFTSKWKYYKS